MQEILRTNSLTQALTLQTALQAAGIEAALRDEHTLGIAGGGVSVVVLDDRATDRTRAILLEIDSLRSEEHTSELQSRLHLVCRLLLEKKKKNQILDLDDSLVQINAQ